MKWPRTIFGPSLLAVLLVMGTCANKAFGWGGRSIEFSPPKNASANPNLLNPDNRDDDSDLSATDPFRAPDRILPQSSLKGAAMPQPQPQPRTTIQSQRLRELLDKKKNWALVDPEEMIPGVTAEDIMHLKDFTADGDLKENLNVTESYYKRQFIDKKKPTDDRAKKGDLKSNRDDDNKDQNDQNSIEALVSQWSGSAMSAQANAGLWSPVGNGDNSVGNFKYSGYKPDDPDKLQAQQASREEFRKLIGLQPSDNLTPASAKNSLFDPLGTPSLPANPWGKTASTMPSKSPADDWNVFSASSQTKTVIKPTVGLTAPTAPAKPTFTPVVTTTETTAETTTEMPNLMFLNSQFSMPKPRFQ